MVPPVKFTEDDFYSEEYSSNSEDGALKLEGLKLCPQIESLKTGHF